MSIRLGKYRIHSRLARGGMAEISLATAHGPEGFSKALAIKRLLPHLAERADIVSMFLDEARLAAGLHHPHIVQIYDLGREGEDHYIAMEYLAGRDLSAIISRSREKQVPLPAHFVAHVAACVADALHFAHEHRGPDGAPQELVHGDISPSNVVVTFVGEVKIVDFGIARAAGAIQAAFPGAIPGKLAYMPPEKIQGGIFDRRGDIFALGVVMYELLTGERLFRREDDNATAQAVLDSVIVDPSALRPDVPESLSRIVLRAIERDPAKRFQTADELRRALDEWFHETGYVPSTARLGELLIELFGEDQARIALAGPVAEPPTATGTAAEPPQLPADLPMTAVPLVLEQRVRGRGRGRAFVRVVGEVPAALMKAGQELVAVPVHVLRSAMSWTRPRFIGAAMLFALAGFAGGNAVHQLRDTAIAANRPASGGSAVGSPIALAAPPEQEAVDEPAAETPEPPAPTAAPPSAPRLRKISRKRPSGGWLVLHGRGQVYLAGEHVGAAPLRRSLPPGAYDVALLDESGHLRGAWIAVVRPGLTTRLTQ